MRQAVTAYHPSNLRLDGAIEAKRFGLRVIFSLDGNLIGRHWVLDAEKGREIWVFASCSSIEKILEFWLSESCWY